MITIAACAVVLEIPPRARRRGVTRGGQGELVGNTSACAEKRHAEAIARGGTRKYLRVRGEEFARAIAIDTPREIPPRARRRGPAAKEYPSKAGNTSACAEKSRGWSWDSPSGGKYLRVRGEETSSSARSPGMAEIPPRARRREGRRALEMERNGNTSACAEKRALARCPSCCPRKYLRVRGEEAAASRISSGLPEIPPRARRRDPRHRPPPPRHGNTSACAEKRHCPESTSSIGWKYLRVRGEET